MSIEKRYFTVTRDDENRCFLIQRENFGLVAKVNFATGTCTYVNTDAVDKDIHGMVKEDISDEFYAIVDELEEEAAKEEFLLPANVVASVMRLIECKKQLAQAVKTVNDQLGDILPEFDPEGFLNDPVEGVDEQDIVEGTVKMGHRNREVLVVDGHDSATLEMDGTFVFQRVGYCEDDYSGNMYLRMEKGKDGAPDKFLKLYYEC